MMKEIITFRTSIENKNMLQELADETEMTLSEMLDLIIEDYNNRISIEDKLKAMKPNQELDNKILTAALKYLLLRHHIIIIFTSCKLLKHEINKGGPSEATLKQLMGFIENAFKETSLILP